MPRSCWRCVQPFQPSAPPPSTACRRACANACVSNASSGAELATLLKRHPHVSVTGLFGSDFTQRVITQMYFPGDPLFAQDPIFHSAGDARDRREAVFERADRIGLGRRQLR